MFLLKFGTKQRFNRHETYQTELHFKGLGLPLPTLGGGSKLNFLEHSHVAYHIKRIMNAATDKYILFPYTHS